MMKSHHFIIPKFCKELRQDLVGPTYLCSRMWMGWFKGWRLESVGSTLIRVSGGWCWLLAATSAELQAGTPTYGLSTQLYSGPGYKNDIWIPRVRVPKERGKKYVTFIHELRPCFEASKYRCLTDLMSEHHFHFHHTLLVKEATELCPRSMKQVTDSITEWEECQGHMVRRVFAMADIAVSSMLQHAGMKVENRESSNAFQFYEPCYLHIPPRKETDSNSQFFS